MNSNAIKKIGSLGLLIGGLVGLIGAVLAVVNSALISVSGVIGMAIMARIGSIIMFVSAIAVVAAAAMAPGSPKGGAVGGMIFGLIAFIGQFMINPYTSLGGIYTIGFSGKIKSAGTAAFIGFVMIAVSGLVLLIMGIVGLASKNKATYNNGMMNQYGMMGQNGMMNQNGMMGQQYNNNNNNNMMGQ